MAYCLVCKTPLPDDKMTVHRGIPEALFECPRCGEFALVGTAMAVMEREGDHSPHRRAITSHAIRRMQRNGGPAIFENELRAIWREERLPNPLQQYDRFVLLIGQRQPSSGEFAGLFIPEVEAQIGMALRKEPATAGGFDWLLRQLQADRLIEFHSGSPKNRNPSHN